MAKDFKRLATDITRLAGGKENITSVFHCMTRLRMTVKDIEKVEQKQISELEGVLGVVYQGGQLQVIIGKDLLNVYDEVMKLGYSDGGSVDENLDDDKADNKLSLGQKVIGYISAAVQPMIPALIAGGMIKVFLLLISKIYGPFAATTTYKLLSIVGNAPFYFMPITVAYGAAKKLGATPMYSMMVAAALIAPEWTGIVSAGEPVSIFGVNAALKGYGSSLLPALLLAIVAYYVEKFLNKVIPGVFKPIFVGTLTLVVTYAVTIVALAPVGQLAGVYVTAAIMWLYRIAGPITMAVFTGLFPYMVMTGMHMTLGAPMVQLLAENGFDPIFRPGMLLSNMAEGGASLGIAIKAKDKEVKSEALSVAIGCIFASVTEPAIYGFNLPLKKPMWAVSIGGAIGGIVAALLGAHNYEYGSSSLFALPIFEDTIIAMIIAIVVTIVAACVLTIVFGFDESLIKKTK
ncbi:MAG: PTS transporter subunit EIIC [Erysipelotrichaceae bacterium]|nr:PTS transporter subunit EIIC [Erysipelotrichaceae bacterium]